MTIISVILLFSFIHIVIRELNIALFRVQPRQILKIILPNIPFIFGENILPNESVYLSILRAYTVPVDSTPVV